jgi:hypothetical protein
MIVWCDSVVFERFIQWSKYINITCCKFRFYRRCWITSHYVTICWSWTLAHMVVVGCFTQQDDAVSEFTLIFVLDLGMKCLKHLRVMILFIVLLHDLKSRSWVLLMSPRSCLGRFFTWSCTVMSSVLGIHSVKCTILHECLPVKCTYSLSQQYYKWVSTVHTSESVSLMAKSVAYCKFWLLSRATVISITKLHLD